MPFVVLNLIQINFIKTNKKCVKFCGSAAVSESAVTLPELTQPSLSSMSIATAAATASTTSSISRVRSCCYYCRAEGIGCSTTNGVTNSWIKSPSDIHKISDNSGLRCEKTFFGVRQFHLLPNGHQNCDLKVSVTADYSDSLPESSSFLGDNGYHPLEELKKCRSVRATKLTDAEIARTTVEANNQALLLFPGIVHSEPHEQVSWAEYQYVIDEFGDVFFEIYDVENILEDREAINPVNALIGIDIPQYENRRIYSSDYSNSETGYSDYIPSHHDYFELKNSEMPDVQVDWGMLDSSSWVHPIYFAKCLAKAINEECIKMMDHPSNGVSLWGHLRPAYIDEESYLRRLFDEDSDGNSWKDGETLSVDSSDDRCCRRSSIYRLEIIKIELFSIYGVQLAVNLEDFQDAEPDILVHSVPALVERFAEQGMRCSFALKALCKKKGLLVDRARLLGVDSLGMDVRVFSGLEVLTHRFPFKVQATSETAAEKQIHQLLFPRSQRKKFRALEKLSDVDSF